MPKQSFSLWDAQLIDNAVDNIVTANGTFDLAVSPWVTNQGFKSLKLILEYGSVTPDFGANPQSFDIDAIVEGESADGLHTFPVAYQFNSFRASFQGTQRIIQLQPTIAGFDAGVDDIIYVGDRTIARVSRQQGNLPDTKFRVRIEVTERDFGGLGAFQSVVLTGYGEAFDA